MAKTRFQRDLEFAQTTSFNVQPDDSFAGLIKNLKTSLEHAFEDAECTAPRVECQKQGLYALRRITTAWKKYPNIAVSLNNSKIDETDLRFTTFDTVKDYPTGSFPRIVAKIVSDVIDPPQTEVDLETENIIQRQRRVDAAVSAMTQQWRTWQEHMVNEGSFKEDNYTADPSELEAAPIEYAYKPDAEPSTGGKSADNDENELYDGQYIYVGGNKPLTTKMEKAQYATKIRAEEADQAKVEMAAKAKAAKVEEAAKAKAAGDATTNAITIGTKRKRGPSLADEEDDQPHQQVPHVGISDFAPLSPGAFAPGDSNTKTKRRTKVTTMSDLVEEDNIVGPEQSQQLPPDPSSWGYGPAPTGSNTTSRPSKRLKTADATTTSTSVNTKASTNTTGDEQASSSPTKGLTVAPDNTQPGGAANKWLRDEDDWGHETIIAHPEWPMPQVYREFNQQFANTAYQDEAMHQPDYRSDWIRFPAPNPMKDKATRPLDICWRSYQSVRQRFEKFKKDVMGPTVQPPYTWTRCPENLALNLPKRAPPPRPGLFRDGVTPVPQVPAGQAQPMGATMAPAPVQAPAPVLTTTYQSMVPPLNTSALATAATSVPAAATASQSPERSIMTKSQTSEQLAEPQEGPVQYFFQRPETPASIQRQFHDAGSVLENDWSETLEDFVAQQSEGEEDTTPSLLVRLQVRQGQSSADNGASMDTGSQNAADTIAPSADSESPVLGQAEGALVNANLNEAQIAQGANNLLMAIEDVEDSGSDGQIIRGVEHIQSDGSES